MTHDLEQLAKLVRVHLIRMTTAAGSGHLTSSLSAVELMTGLLFSGVFRADLKRPDYPNNDRLIFSKGHAAPLLYALYAVAGAIPSAELLKLRKFGSRLEGHPMPTFRYTEFPTGSLGQGLSVALGEALAAKMDRLSYRVYCLLGDSEMAEGNVWEAIQLAGYRKTANLVGILDLNRLGQSGPTMLQHDAKKMAARIRSFDWNVLVVDGHNVKEVVAAYAQARRTKDQPTMIIGKTVKGKGVRLIENKGGWHGKVLSKEQAQVALKELGTVGAKRRGVVPPPKRKQPAKLKRRPAKAPTYKLGELVSPREALGRGLVRLAPAVPNLVVLDGEVKNSTYTELFEKKFPKRFVQGFVAEQNAVGMSGGFAQRNKRPVFATFAAFLTRAFDQLRMLSYAKSQAIFIGTHAGVHIGGDGASQMGLQDIAMFRTLEQSTVLYPSDAVAAEKLLEKSFRADGVVYLRATRAPLPVIYKTTQTFAIGGSHVLRRSRHDQVTLVAAGATLPEALKAAELLVKKKVGVRVIDVYSIKPIDAKTLRQAVRETGRIMVIEDHYPEGGIAEAVRTALGKDAGHVISLAVAKTPRSGQPDELYVYEELDANSIVKTIIKII